MKKPPKKPQGQPKQKSGEKKSKKKYKVRNWKEYNEALVNRGRIEFWLSEEGSLVIPGVKIPLRK
jgi:hypothetical protein